METALTIAYAKYNLHTINLARKVSYSQTTMHKLLIHWKIKYTSR